MNYNRTYLLSLLVWSVSIGGVLVAGPHLVEITDTKAKEHYYRRFQQAYIEPLEGEINALEAEGQATVSQYQQKISVLEEKIDTLEKDARNKRLDMSYGNSDLLHDLASGDSVTVNFSATVRCEAVEFGYKAIVTSTAKSNQETWIYTNLGECFENNFSAPTSRSARTMKIGTVGEYEVGVLRLLPTSLI